MEAITMTGDMNLDAVEAFFQSACQPSESPGDTTIRCKDVSFMGSAALQCLISMQKTLAAQGHKLLLKELPEDTQETITLLGLNRLTDQKE